MERRERQEVNRNQHSTHGTPSPAQGANDPVSRFKLESQNNSWWRIGRSAKDLTKVFNNLLCHFNVQNFREAFRALDAKKAVGIDGITKREYGANLEGNLEVLVGKIHKGTYRPIPKRQVLIPKADGKTRPIAVAALEDKLVEWIAAKILSALYEPAFYQCSYGFRPKRNAAQAVKHFFLGLKDRKRPAVVDIDLAQFFDSVPHRPLIKILEKRISDKRFSSLISRLLEAEIMKTDGEVIRPDTGTPQGSIASPVLANIYLHHVLDRWFAKYRPQEAMEVRYADDVVFSFKDDADAKAFYDALTNRIQQYGLRINEEKSRVLSFTPRSGQVFNFAGFTFYWGRDRGSGKRRLKVKTEKKRLYRKIQEYKTWIKRYRNRVSLTELWDTTAAKLRGHYNFFGISGNRAKLCHFYHSVIGLLFRWINRRSQKSGWRWPGFAARLRAYPLPLPPQDSQLLPLIDRKVYAF